MIQYVKDYSFYMIFVNLIDEYYDDIITDELDFLVTDAKSSTPEANFIDYSFINSVFEFIVCNDIKKEYIKILNENNLYFDYSNNKQLELIDYSTSLKPTYVII